MVAWGETFTQVSASPSREQEKYSCCDKSESFQPVDMPKLPREDEVPAQLQKNYFTT